MSILDRIPGLKQKFDANQAADIDVRELIDWMKVFSCRIAVASLGIVTLTVVGSLVVAFYKQPPARELLVINGGIVEALPEWDGDLTVLGNQKLRALTEQNLELYAMACEGYYWGSFKADDERCAAMGSDKVNKERAQRYESGNPDSPIVKYSDGTTVRVEVVSRIPVDAEANPPSQWRVRMRKWTRIRGIGEEKPSYWEATATVGYGKRPAKAEHVRHNRLGFIVAEWRVYPESQPSAVARAAP